VPRRAAKKDANHNEIAEEFERWGCTVIDTSALPEFVDMLVWRHETRLIEAKSATGKRTKAQVELAKKWPGPIYVVRSAIEARALVQAWDKEEDAKFPF